MTPHASQCGLVSPFWVVLGTVHWAGTAAREKLMNIEYRRCTNAGELCERDGFVGYRCSEHGGGSL